MEAYIFHEGSLQPAVPLDYEQAIFNLPEFGELQAPLEAVVFYLLDQRKNKAVAGIRFHLEGNRAWSPYRAPFGSVEFSPQLNPLQLYRFIEYFESKLKEKGVRDIFIKNPPHGYDPRRCSLLETFFLNQNYLPQEAELSTIIPVDDTPFPDLIRNSERLRIHQSERAGLKFQEFAPARVREIYDFISACHREKGYSISISAEHLVKTFAAFPGKYHLFAVVDNEKIRAAAVSIDVTKNVRYNFLANQAKEYNQLSPSVLLMEGIYGHCRKNKIGLLDLGASALDGKPNFLLLDFKLHIGGAPSSKFSFHKKTG